MANNLQNDLQEAKSALDLVIKKSRIHLYKPIQIAEILHRDRVKGDIDLANLETYRNKSKAWRDEMCIALLGRVSTSSAKFQDDLFNAIPPRLLVALGIHNKAHNGIVEAYIYQQFISRYTQLKNALAYSINADKATFQVKEFIDLFWREAGLKRSIDKIYEIIVCKDAERDIIASLLSQIGYASKITSIITESHLVEWYEKALREKFANTLGDEVLKNLQVEIMEEFPPTKKLPRALKNRHYEVLNNKESIFKHFKGCQCLN